MGKILFILFVIAFLRSAYRCVKARRISDGLFAAFWLAMMVNSVIDWAPWLVIPIGLLIAGAIAKAKESPIPRDPADEESGSPDEKPQTFVLSEPPPARPITGPDSGLPSADPSADSNQGNSSEEEEGRLDPEELIERIPEFAEDCVTLGKIHKRTLDYTPESLTALDEVVTMQWGDGAPVFPGVAIIQVGSYTGEVIRLNLGGTWTYSDDYDVHLVGIAGKDTKAFPINKARKRIYDGEDDSLAFFYQALKHVLEKES